MGRRTLLLIAALVVAVLGTVLVFLYAQNAQNDGAGRASPSSRSSWPRRRSTVGTSGDDRVVQRRLRAAEGPQGHAWSRARSPTRRRWPTSSPSSRSSRDSRSSASSGDAAATSGLALPAGTVAVQVALGDPRARRRVRGTGLERRHLHDRQRRRSAAGAAAGPVARVLLPSVPVVAVGSTTTTSTTRASTTYPADPHGDPHPGGHPGPGQKILFVSGAGRAAPYTGLIPRAPRQELQDRPGQPRHRRKPTCSGDPLLGYPGRLPYEDKD